MSKSEILIYINININISKLKNIKNTIGKLTTCLVTEMLKNIPVILRILHNAFRWTNGYRNLTVDTVLAKREMITCDTSFKIQKTIRSHAITTRDLLMDPRTTLSSNQHAREMRVQFLCPEKSTRDINYNCVFLFYDAHVIPYDDVIRNENLKRWARKGEGKKLNEDRWVQKDECKKMSAERRVQKEVCIKMSTDRCAQKDECRKMSADRCAQKGAERWAQRDVCSLFPAHFPIPIFIFYLLLPLSSFSFIKDECGKMSTDRCAQKDNAERWAQTDVRRKMNAERWAQTDVRRKMNVERWAQTDVRRKMSAEWWARKDERRNTSVEKWVLKPVFRTQSREYCIWDYRIRICNYL